MHITDSRTTRLTACLGISLGSLVTLYPAWNLDHTTSLLIGPVAVLAVLLILITAPRTPQDASMSTTTPPRQPNHE